MKIDEIIIELGKNEKTRKQELKKILGIKKEIIGLKRFDFYDDLSIQGKRNLTNILFALGMLE